MRLGLALSEKQIPRFVGNVSSWKQRMDLLESGFVRPRQARYQAALRPDMKCSVIIEHFPGFLPPNRPVGWQSQRFADHG